MCVKYCILRVELTQPSTQAQPSSPRTATPGHEGGFAPNQGGQKAPFWDPFSSSACLHAQMCSLTLTVLACEAKSTCLWQFSFMHSIIQQIFIEHSLWAWCWSRYWGYRREQNTIYSCLEAYSSLGRSHRTGKLPSMEDCVKSWADTSLWEGEEGGGELAHFRRWEKVASGQRPEEGRKGEAGTAGLLGRWGLWEDREKAER